LKIYIRELSALNNPLGIKLRTIKSIYFLPTHAMQTNFEMAYKKKLCGL
jgi:hypothetical protein